MAGSVPTSGGKLFAEINLPLTKKQYKNDNIANFVYYGKTQLRHSFTGKHFGMGPHHFYSVLEGGYLLALKTWVLSTTIIQVQSMVTFSAKLIMHFQSVTANVLYTCRIYLWACRQTNRTCHQWT